MYSASDRSTTTFERLALLNDWQIGHTAPGQACSPAALLEGSIQWVQTKAPSTVADSLKQANLWHLDHPEFDLDAFDWWYRLSFTDHSIASHAAGHRPESVLLHFDGLATIVDVWLNDAYLLHSENMFRCHACDISALLRSDNLLLIRFASVTHNLTQRRPRPGWKVPMIAHQQLRWIRTTVLGRTPGWSPPAPPIGPWRDVWLEIPRGIRHTGSVLRTRASQHNGIASWSAQLHAPADHRIVDGILQLSYGERTYSAPIKSLGNDCFEAELDIQDPQLWWPHTHGLQPLYTASLEIQSVDGQHHMHLTTLALGRTAFRDVSVDTNHDQFAVRINGTDIFCRGACWMPLDVISLNATETQLRKALVQAKDAGMNMLRISGTTIYESDAFYELCDELGILIWQEFMFASMDYPETPEFIAEVSLEVTELLGRVAHHPCLAILCGNSEVEQQAAMFGATRERWSPSLFHETIANLVAQHCPEIPYWPSSAHGGALPFQNDAGTTSYYGVGAYLRPLEDARRSSLQFASECLAFANVPESECLEHMPGGLSLRAHHPQWKARTPRDLGAGWDFEDVRDHYLATLFRVDPVQLRYSDHDRYLELSRVVTGEVMAATFNEWRSDKSSCHGALIWFLKDFWPGAGWGIIDAQGRPKAAYHYVRRALQPVSISLSDEGCNGIYLHLINERSSTFDGAVELSWYKHSEYLVKRIRQDISMPARNKLSVASASWLDYFSDLNHAYRFGPPQCDAVVARLYGSDGQLTGEDWLWPQGRPCHQQPDIGLEASIIATKTMPIALLLRTRKLAQAITLHVDQLNIANQYFHLAPGEERVIPLVGHPGGKITGYAKALNCSKPAQFHEPERPNVGSLTVS